MKLNLFLVLGIFLSGCSAPPLPAMPSPDPADPQAPAAAAPDKPVMAGTAAHVPVGLKSWKELNERVAPGAGRSP